MHSSARQQGSILKVGIALAALFMVLATPPGLAFLRGIGGVPPAPAARDQGAHRRSGDLPPLTSIQGDEG